MKNSILENRFQSFNEAQLLKTIVELEYILEHLYRTLCHQKTAS
jgi:hypothetical protein